MLNSLYIRNYRNLKELKIDSVSRINLITGKNNTGKSGVLEALAIYKSNGELITIKQLLEIRGETFQKTKANNFFQAFSSLFIDNNTEKTISIGNLNDDITLRFVKYFDDIERDDKGNIISRKHVVLQDKNENKFVTDKQGLEIKKSNLSWIVPFDRQFEDIRINLKERNFQFIRANDIDRNINETLFDKITLTPKENYVVEALKIIEPKTERIAFIAEDNFQMRKAVIKLSDQENVIPLQSMGDGINRILSIILALVNAENGFLLIDEFENGLHYTVQEQLWKIIFKLAKDLNVQVFATTHSNDCINSFSEVLNRNEYEVSGQMIRLDNVKGVIKPEIFTVKDLEIATRQEIDIR